MVMAQLPFFLIALIYKRKMQALFALAFNAGTHHLTSIAKCAKIKHCILRKIAVECANINPERRKPLANL
jgi:hypothetical protein